MDRYRYWRQDEEDEDEDEDEGEDEDRQNVVGWLKGYLVQGRQGTWYLAAAG
jgi:hypothetical protein